MPKHTDYNIAIIRELGGTYQWTLDSPLNGTDEILAAGKDCTSGEEASEEAYKALYEQIKNEHPIALMSEMLANVSRYRIWDK